LFNQKLSKLGLTYPQSLVLITLLETDGLTVKALSLKLKLDSGTITPILKRLEKAGLLSRQRSKNDERSVNVFLTTAAKDLQREVADIQKKVVCETGLSETEFVELRGTLHSLLETMTTQLKEATAA
jgi:DNA-binding MarR family transcriptional regulator